ncbi:MAG: putative Ig domain-containing protein [Leptospiraceae bacterium]|nr:putative Ig domain-containing protein [Leptospiraceae bacterium]MCZ8347419.1 putative Ig domain-containing protein [Leptospiraceae bacterium]
MIFKYLSIMFILFFTLGCPKEKEEDLSSLFFISALGGTNSRGTITSVSPKTFYIGSTVTITGTDLTGKTVSIFNVGVTSIVPTTVISGSDTEVKLRITGAPPSTTENSPGISINGALAFLGSTNGLSFVQSLTSNITQSIFAEVNVTNITTTNSTTSGLTFTVNPSLPTGLTLNTTTGTISGTPTASTGNSAVSYTLTGTNTDTTVGGSVTGTFTMTIVTNAQRVARTCNTVGTGAGCFASAPFTCTNSSSCYTTYSRCTNDSQCGF